jgi:hypothetical protein
MSADEERRPGFSLRRWSVRKHAAARVQQPVSARGESPEPPVPPRTETVAPERTAGDEAPAPLPPVESLTPESDFVPFMRPDVAEGLRRAALRKLFSDPHFNVMDGLDVYIDDYSKPDPLGADLIKRLAQARYILDPPDTRVNEHGYVEDLPLGQPEEESPEAAQPQPAAPSGAEPAAPSQHADTTAPGDAASSPASAADRALPG